MPVASIDLECLFMVRLTARVWATLHFEAFETILARLEPKRADLDNASVPTMRGSRLNIDDKNRRVISSAHMQAALSKTAKGPPHWVARRASEQQQRKSSPWLKGLFDAGGYFRPPTVATAVATPRVLPAPPVVFGVKLMAGGLV